MVSMPCPTNEEQIKLARAWVRIVGADYPHAVDGMLKVHCYLGDQNKRMWANIRKSDGAIRYLRKYAGKQSQKQVPPQYRNVGRFWGTSRDVPRKLESLDYVPTTDRDMREILKALGREDIADWDVIPKYIHV